MLTMWIKLKILNYTQTYVQPNSMRKVISLFKGSLKILNRKNHPEKIDSTKRNNCYVCFFIFRLTFSIV